jgi:hypothetical protein
MQGQMRLVMAVHDSANQLYYFSPTGNAIGDGLLLQEMSPKPLVIVGMALLPESQCVSLMDDLYRLPLSRTHGKWFTPCVVIDAILEHLFTEMNLDLYALLLAGERERNKWEQEEENRKNGL